MRGSISYIVILLVVSGVSHTSEAQMDFRYSQYIYNPIVLNPASTGQDLNYNISAFHKSQWASSQTIFNSAAVTLSTPIYSNGLSFGAIIRCDYNLPGAKSEMYITSSYKVNTKHGLLSFGLAGGLQQIRYDESDFLIKDENDPLYEGMVNTSSPDINVGIHYQSSRFYLGLSTLHIVSSSTMTQENIQTFFTSGAKFTLTDKLTWIPTALYRKSFGASQQFELTNHVKIKDVYWAGLGLRTTGDFAIHAGMYLNELLPSLTAPLLIGYAFENHLVNVHPGRKGSHEIMLRLGIKPLPNPSNIRKHRVQVSPIFF